jgi:2-polyprenyl-3-methyl-5-hydroxy-6-metoxy-1,4-benzoquinol methylase
MSVAERGQAVAIPPTGYDQIVPTGYDAIAPTGYDAIADWYSVHVRSSRSIHAAILPSMLALLGDVDGSTVCDLGCGEGVVSRLVARRGAQVVGVDLSVRLLAIAVEHEDLEPLNIEYRLEDASSLAGFDDGCIDGVVSNLALADIADLEGVARSVARVLCPGGWFVFSINHPCGPCTGPDGTLHFSARDYFAEGFWRSPNPESVRGRVGAHHRTLATYLNALTGAGLALEGCAEPRATPAMAARVPSHERVPLALVMRWRSEA